MMKHISMVWIDFYVPPFLVCETGCLAVWTLFCFWVILEAQGLITHYSFFPEAQIFPESFLKDVEKWIFFYFILFASFLMFRFFS
jgi:hypothetical protein